MDLLALLFLVVMVDTDDTRRTMDYGRQTTPGVWHELPTGELKKIEATKAFFIIDWFTDQPTLLFGKLKKNKIGNPYILFPPLLIFILIMYRKNKNNKNSTFVPQKTHKLTIASGGQHIKTDNFEITIYFCSFSIL